VIDEKASELISRALDGDLDDAERADLERRLADQPELEAALADSARIKQAVAAIAGAMQPPAELDAVIEPLRRGTPPTQPAVRSALRWLGAAAAVVLGVTVTLEVARRNPTPAVDRPAAPRPERHDDREIFELAPLPSAVPAENRPVGATDQLLDEDLDQPEVPEPAALEVLGPLASDEAIGEQRQRGAAADRAPEAPTGPPEPSNAVEDAARAAGEGTKTGKDSQSASRRQPFGSGPVEQATGPSAAPLAKAERATPGAATVSGAAHDEAGRLDAGGPSEAALLVAGAEVWRGPAPGCAVGRHTITVEVVDGAVIGVDTGGAAAAPGEECRIDQLVGTSLPGVDDGPQPAELVVRPTG
jgi:hypothetical protein